jgi:hypothetical protein
MIDMQQILVADRIARLDEEAAALRAERRFGRAVTASPSPRVRLGRWLVSVGSAIAGTAVAGTGRPGDDPASSLRRVA